MSHTPFSLRPWFCGVLLLGCTTGTSTPVVAHATDAGLTCIVCSVWQVRCGDRCVDLTVSPDNCGGCGVLCDTRSQVCTGGVCMAVTSRCTPLGGVDGGASDASDEAADDVAASASDAGGVLDGTATDVPVVSVDITPTGNTGLRGEYYNSTTLTQLLLVRTDPTVNFNWNTASPDPLVPQTNFSVRWTGQVTAVSSGTYTFITESDDGARLWVNEQLLVDDWTSHGPTEDTGTITLTAGTSYDLRLEYYQGTGGAEIQLLWSGAGVPREIIPTTQLIPGTGVDDTCVGGACCPAGGSEPVCCPVGTTCVVNANFAGCCPAGEACGVPPTCGGDIR